jgi:hypothetical protein
VSQTDELCLNANENVDNHFPQVEKLVGIGSGDMLVGRGIYPEQLHLQKMSRRLNVVLQKTTRKQRLRKRKITNK